MFEGESILWFLLLIPILYLGAPLFVLLTQRVAAHPKFEALNFDQLSPATAQFLMSRTKGLFELGFDEPTLFHLVDAVPNVTAYKIMLVNRPAGDKALVSAVIAQHRRVFLVEFCTRFEDGEVFDTHNISTPLTRPFPGHVRTH